MSATDGKPEDPFASPYPLALYKHLRFGYVVPSNFYGEAEDAQQHENRVRISEPVEVRFTSLKNEQVIQNAVAACDAAERAAYNELNAKLAEIRETKRSLLALTYQPAAP